MIYVKRNQTDQYDQVIRPNDGWFDRAREKTERAIEEQTDHVPDRNVYAHDQVRMSLEQLFSGKCAYCETSLEGFDVEHFRPKGGVAERPDHPGYYWLTYTWENLYPSCANCNRHLKDRPLWEDRSPKPAGGKAVQFPLFDETSRAMKPADDIAAETRLLIDPCLENPEEHFGYTPEGHVFSLNDPDGDNPNDVGSRTIKVMFLGRTRLTKRRRTMIRMVMCTMKLLDTNDGMFAKLTELRRELGATDCEYAGVVRYTTLHPHNFLP